MIVEHKKSGELGHVHDFTSVKMYQCTTCDATASNFSGGAPFCTTCQKYMVPSGFIPEANVVEIKNRKLNLEKGSTPKKRKGRKGRAEDNLIQKAVYGTVYPRSGSPELKLAVNLNDEMFIRGMVVVKWGDLSFNTSIHEIGAAFSHFDPTPTKTVRDDGIDISTGQPLYTPIEIPAKAVKKTVMLGPLTVSGGKNQRQFENMFAEFKWGSQTATFCLSDICQILIPAI